MTNIYITEDQQFGYFGWKYYYPSTIYDMDLVTKLKPFITLNIAVL